ncbi:MAG: metallophosphoesterase [Terriglobia bacterium]
MTKVLVVGDLHCGSIYGLLPPGFERVDGGGRLTYARQQVWQSWLDMRQATKGADVVIVNGDLIDGKQEAQRQTEMNLATVEEQVDAATICLQQLKPKKEAKWYFIQGTEYHDQKGCPTVEQIAQRFNGETPLPKNNQGAGLYSWEVIDLEVEKGVVLNVQHGTGVGQGFYRATPYDREAIFSALAGKDGVVPKADCVIRSHAHFFIHLEHASKHIVGVPCWELQTRFMRKNSAYRMIPDIGAVVIYVDGEAKARGLDPITVQKCLYQLPARKAVKGY